MTRTARTFFLILLAGATIASAQTPKTDDSTANPVAHVRDTRAWEYGPFINWGTGVGDRSDYKFLTSGFQLGKPITPVVRAGIVTGQLELSGNIMPLWQAYTPAPHQETFYYPGPGCPSSGCAYVAPEGGGHIMASVLLP